ncbi:MAG: acyl--CoA ligase [Deltaproteobacteria bacterium]|nr:acyl--CoA ligase [Deltaproteobacteria bacterium]
MAAERGLISRAYEALTHPVDPLSARARRVVRVALGRGFVGDLHVRSVPGMLLAAYEHGLRNRTIHELHAINQPQRLCVADDRRSLTYAEANQEMNRVGNALRSSLEVTPGTPVILMMENCAEYLVTWFALSRISARAVHASYRLTAAELEYLVRHSGTRVVVVSPSTLPVADKVRVDRPELGLRIVVVGGEQTASPLLPYDQLVATGALQFPEPPAVDQQAQNIVYTSGTTGKPKGAMRDFASYGVVELARLLERLPFRVGERHLVVAPLYHSGGQVFSLLMAALGASTYLRPHFEPLDALRALSRHAIHSMFIVPTMLRKILQLPDEEFRANPTREIRGIVSGAAEFPHALRVEAAQRFGAEAIHDFYGATELGWITFISGPDMLRKPGSVGTVMAGQQVKIMDRDGQELPPGDVGLIYVRNAQTMGGYLHDDEATQASMRDGWMTVEDLGRMDSEGFLFLAGRDRDMVKSGGVNIYPVEIEEVLSRHPAVSEAAVIGIPDPEWGEKLLALVVPRHRAGFDVADVEKFARAELAGFKVPKRWEIVDDLPRNNTGKIVKKELRARYAPPVAGS